MRMEKPVVEATGIQGKNSATSQSNLGYLRKAQLPEARPCKAFANTMYF